MLVALRTFLARFGSERACRDFLLAARWGAGFACPRCGSTTRPCLITTRDLYQCRSCRYQASLTAGTILENTKLPLRTWFLGALLVLSTKKGLSSPELARRLGVTQKTAWFMVHRLAAMATEALPVEIEGTVERATRVLANPREARRYDGWPPEEVVLALVNVDAATPGALRLLPAPGTDEIDLVTLTTHHTTAGRVTEPGAKRRSTRSAARLALENLDRVMTGVHTRFAPRHLPAYLDLFSWRFTGRDDLGRATLAGLAAAARVPRRTRFEIAHASPM